MEDNKIRAFLSKHRSKFTYLVLAVVCATLWGGRLWSKNHSTHKQDFLVAHQIFDRFCQGEPLAIEAIEVTENILKRHPELHPKYDAMLATTYFAQQNLNKGLDYARLAIDRTQTGLPSFYQDFTQTTLLIAEESYEQAFEQAQYLNNTLQNQQGYETLYVMNLLQLIFLADETGHAEIKKESWEKLQKEEAYATLKPLFQEGEFSLAEYIFECSLYEE